MGCPVIVEMPRVVDRTIRTDTFRSHIHNLTVTSVSYDTCECLTPHLPERLLRVDDAHSVSCRLPGKVGKVVAISKQETEFYEDDGDHSIIVTQQRETTDLPVGQTADRCHSCNRSMSDGEDLACEEPPICARCCSA